MVLERLKQIFSHVYTLYSPQNETETSYTLTPYPGLSYHVGRVDKPLKHVTLGELLQEQVVLNGDSEAVVSAWQGIRWTYRDLKKLSDELARSFWTLGIRKGDRISIMAGNCAEYVQVAWLEFKTMLTEQTFFAAAKIGAILAVINPAYKEEELTFALNAVGNEAHFASN
jgi:mevalonyl-CoA ligase